MAQATAPSPTAPTQARPAAALVGQLPAGRRDFEVTLPGSKSYTNRALVMAALTEGPVEITGASDSDDSAAMLDCLRELGIRVSSEGDCHLVEGSVADVRPDRTYHLNARLAGTTIRFATALAAVTPGTKRVFGLPPLNGRPIGELVSALRQLGADITYLEREGYPPIEIRPAALAGGPSGGRCHLAGGISSQYFTALLMIAPAIGGLTIDVDGEQTSRSYIDMTFDGMRAFGAKDLRNEAYRRYVVPPTARYRARSYAVEADWSSAGYFLALAALSRTTITLRNVNPISAQGDRAFGAILARMGNRITVGDDGASVTLHGSGVRPVDVDMNACPDQVQTLAAVAAFADGVTRISGIATLRVKETDRVRALEQELARMGVFVASDEHSISICGGSPRAAAIQTYDDHRMAMSFAVAATAAPGTGILDPYVVSKSFPEFWTTLESLGIPVTFTEAAAASASRTAIAS